MHRVLARWFTIYEYLMDGVQVAQTRSYHVDTVCRRCGINCEGAGNCRVLKIVSETEIIIKLN